MQDVLESAYPETMSVAPVCIGMAFLSDKPLSAQLGTAVERAIGRDREKAILYRRCVVDGEEPGLVGRAINLSRSRSYEILQQVCEEVLRFVRAAIAEECGVPEDEVFEELIGCFNGPREAATRPAREFHDLLAPPVDTPAPAPQ
jgi:ribosomal protein S14